MTFHASHQTSQSKRFICDTTIAVIAGWFGHCPKMFLSWWHTRRDYVLVTCICMSAALSDVIYLKILGTTPLHCKNASHFFAPPLLSTSHYYIICIIPEIPVSFQRNPLFWALGNHTARQPMISRACIDTMGSESPGKCGDLFSVMLIHAGQKSLRSSQFPSLTVYCGVRFSDWK